MWLYELFVENISFVPFFVLSFVLISKFEKLIPNHKEVIVELLPQNNYFSN